MKNGIHISSMHKGIIFIASSLLFTGCYTPLPEIDPYFYAPKTAMSAFVPSSEEKVKTKKIDSPKPIVYPQQGGIVTLASLIDVALHNNPDMGISWYTARSAAAAYGASRSDYYPTINFEADVTTIRGAFEFATGGPGSGGACSSSSGSTQLTSQQQTSMGPEVSLQYVLFDFGMRSAQAEEMLQALENANYSHNETLQTIMKSVADSYYQYLYQYAYLEALFANLNDAQVSLNAAKDRLSAGVAGLSEFLQARTHYLQIQVDVASQEGAVKNAFVALLKTLGLPSDTVFATGSFPDNPNIEQFSFNAGELLELAKESRPSITALRASVLSKQAALDYAKAQPLPVLSTNITGGARYYTIGEWDGGNYVAELQLSFPLFAGFMYRNQIREAEQNVKTALYDLEAEELSVSQEVMSYYNDFNVAKQEMLFTKEFLQSAAEEFQVILSNYEMGTNTILDVLSSQSSLASARAKWVSAKRNFYTSIVNISFAVGQLNANEIATLEQEEK